MKTFLAELHFVAFFSHYLNCVLYSHMKRKACLIGKITSIPLGTRKEKTFMTNITEPMNSKNVSDKHLKILVSE